ncbi:PepSY-like domain-containing protein [Limibacter armeniacum]|uniref:PepSY-like domain-containing protein n=1 Tax=Limibacter armeniacum TaxID=466084 RepID=UPI002FE5DED9
MKKNILAIALALFGFSSSVIGQDIPQSLVPSVIQNNFKKTFPNAKDVEWEQEGEMYQVEFETGWDIDHDVWYNSAGEIVKHEEDIYRRSLPEAINNKLNTEFSRYAIDDLKKISSSSHTAYTLELKSFTEEWKIAFDETGKVLSKIAD